MKALDTYQIVLLTSVFWTPLVILGMVFATLEYIHQTEKRK